MDNTGKTLLVCDLDNTLYDWVSYFVPSFYAMVEKVIEITDCDREKLLDDFKIVHQKHHDSEHPFSLLETEIVRTSFRGLRRPQIAKILDPAFHAFNSNRKRLLKLHPGVSLTLATLARSDVVLVAHTDSKLYGAVDRLRRLELTKYFSRIYCRERPNSDHPDPDSGVKWLADFPMEKVVELRRHQTKPDPSVLLEICSAEGFSISETAYIGDSMARDVLMAKRAGVYAIWAAYGAGHDEAKYAKLVRISHWTEDDIETEKKLKEEAAKVRPEFTAYESFSEVLEALNLASNSPDRIPEKVNVGKGVLRS